MCGIIFSSPWIHHLNINADRTESPNHSRSVLQCHICMAKGCASDGETVWTDTQLCPWRVDGKYANFLQKRLSLSLSLQATKPKLHCRPAEHSPPSSHWWGQSKNRNNIWVSQTETRARPGALPPFPAHVSVGFTCSSVPTLHSIESGFIFQNICARACFLTLVFR